MDNKELSEKLEEILENPRGFLEKFILLTQQVVELRKLEQHNFDLYTKSNETAMRLGAELDSKIKVLEGLNHTLKVKCDDLIEDLNRKTRELRKRWERIEELDRLSKEKEEQWQKTYHDVEARAVYHEAATATMKVQMETLQEDNTALLKLLFLHRRFHNKVGCPGGDECYVCKEDNE